jgi:putative ABC transport system permease protein
MRDLRYAVRTLRKQPLFSLVAILTLTLGIGANTAIFSLLYHTLLRPLPFPDADRLVFVWNTYPGINLNQANVSIPDYLDRRTQAAAIEDATLFTPNLATLNEGGNPEQVGVLQVTPSFFSTLQRQPAIGRAFTDDEARPDADRYVILTNGLWRSHFGGDPAIVGRDIRVSGTACRVVGVLPADVELPAPNIALLMPFAFTPAQMSDAARGNEFSMMIARLRPGTTIAQLDGQMQAISEHVMERLPARAGFMKSSRFGGYAVPLREELVGDVRTPLLVMQACVLFVLVIACINVANLLLMQATARSREFAIRTTLGAGQWQIVKQMLAEGLVLASVGGTVGLVVGVTALDALVRFELVPRGVPGAPPPAMHPAVMGFGFALVVITGLIFGGLPALAVARGNTAAFLKDDSTRGTASRRVGALRGALVVGEIAAALTLLVGAGLLLKSFAKLQHVDPGFSPENVLTAQLSLPAARYADDASRIAFANRLLERLRAMAGVAVAALTTNVPFNGNVASGSYSIVGRAVLSGEAAPHGRQEIVGGDYFKAMRIPLVAGRTFTDGDTIDAPRVIVVDEYLVRKYFANRSPLGQQIQRGGPASAKYTIVGVVGTINSIDLGQPVTKERIYYPATQLAPRNMAIVLKTAIDPQTLVPSVRAAVRAVDPEQPLSNVRTMDQWMARSLQTRRAPTVLLAIFASVALALSAVGIYGVLAFAVAQRVREFGIRQALGAAPASILSLVLRQGLRTAAAGVLIGLGGSIVLARYLQTLLFGVTARDAGVLASVTGLLLAVALLACYLPARRATRIDPLAALRES